MKRLVFGQRKTFSSATEGDEGREGEGKRREGEREREGKGRWWVKLHKESTSFITMPGVPYN